MDATVTRSNHRRTSARDACDVEPQAGRQLRHHATHSGRMMKKQSLGLLMLCWPRMNDCSAGPGALYDTGPVLSIRSLYREPDPRYQSISCTIVMSFSHARPLGRGPRPQTFQIFTTCLTIFLQIGQSWPCICLAHSSHELKCPQGKKIASISFSQHMWQK